jgi:autotransporter-associated beta strand protein
MKKNPSLKTRSTAPFLQAIFSLPSTHRNLFLGLAIFAVGAFGNSVQAQWVNESFSTLTAGVAPTVALPLSANGDGFAKGVSPSGGALQIQYLGTTNGCETRWSLSTTNFSTPRTSGYIAFKILQNANTNVAATNYCNFRVGPADSSSLGTSANNWLELRFVQAASSNLKISCAGGANLATGTISSSAQVPIQIWYNQSGSTTNYTRPDTGVSTSLASGTFAVFANSVAILAPGTFPAGITATAAVTTAIGKFAFIVSSTQKADFTIDDVYAADSAPAVGIAPTLTTNSISVSPQVGASPVSGTVLAGGNPTPVFSKSGWPAWATLATNGAYNFAPTNGVATGITNLGFVLSNSIGTNSGTFIVNVVAASSTPPAFNSALTNVTTARYLAVYPATNAHYTLTLSAGDAPITYSSFNLPTGLSTTNYVDTNGVTNFVIVGSATTLGQSRIATLTASNTAGTKSIELPINVAAYTWNGTSSNWISASSWDFDNQPTANKPASDSGSSGESPIFGVAGGSGTSVYLSSNQGVNGLLFNSNSAAYVFSGSALSIGGAVGLTNNSTSTITFNNLVANASSDGTWGSVAGGSIVLDGGFNCNTSSSAASRTVTLGGAGDFSVGGVIGNGASTNTAVGSIVVASTGKTTFSGENTYSGTTTVSTGANLKLGNVAALGATNGATIVSGTLDLFGFSPAGENFTLSGGTIVNSGSAASTIDGTVALSAGNNTINTTNADVTLSGVVSGAATLVKTGANTLTLSGTNTSTGTLIINQGTVNASSLNALGNSAITVNGGLLNATANDVWVAASTKALTISNGTAVISGSNSTYKGVTTVAGGTLRLVNSSALGATGSVAKCTLSGGRVEATVDYDMAHTYGVSTNTNGITFDKLDGVNTTFNGPVEMNVASGVTLGLYKLYGNTNASSVVTKTGAGTLQVRGAAGTGFFGDLLVNEGTLFVNTSGSAAMGTSNAVVLNGGSLLYSKGVGSSGFYSGMGQDNGLRVQQNGTLTLDPNPATGPYQNTLSFLNLSISNQTLTMNKGTNAKSSADVGYVDPAITFNTATLNGSATFNVGSNMDTVLLVGTGSGGVTKTGAGKLRVMDSPNSVGASAKITAGAVSSIAVGAPVPGFSNPNPIVSITAAPLGGTNATAVAIVSNNYLTGFTVVNSGSGYTVIPQVTVVADNPVTVNRNTGSNNISGGTLNLSGSHSSSFNVQGGGVLELNYQAASEASSSVDGTSSIDQSIKYIVLTKSVAGYTSAPVVTIDVPRNLDGTLVTTRSFTPATATAEVANGRVTRIVLSNQGQGYWALAPKVTITPPQQGTVVATTTGSLSFASNSTVRVTVPSAPTGTNRYTLMTASNGIIGTPTLNLIVDGAPTTGYTLDVNGNNLELKALVLVTPTVTVTPAAGGYTYSGAIQGPGFNQVNTGNSTGGVTFSYAGTGSTSYGPSATPPISAGTYTLTATVAADSTYNEASSTPTAFEIRKVAITVTANGGQSKKANNADPVFTYATSGALVNGDQLTGALSRATGETVGTYNINIGNLTAGANYILNYVGASFEIQSSYVAPTFATVFEGAGATNVGADGMPNLLRYAMGATNVSAPVVKPVSSLDTTNLSIVAIVRTNDPKVTIVGEYATDLTAWNTNKIAGEPTLDQAGATLGETERQVFNTPRGNNKTFLRLKATQAP